MTLLSFTKEELIELSDYCNAWEPPGLYMSDFRVDIWNKIQYLIEHIERQEKTEKIFSEMEFIK